MKKVYFWCMIINNYFILKWSKSVRSLVLWSKLSSIYPHILSKLWLGSKIGDLSLFDREIAGCNSFDWRL